MADDVNGTPLLTTSGGTSTAIALPNIRNDDTVELDLSAKVSTIRLYDANSLTLTPDLWANIFGYARYEDCLRAFTVCKSFLDDVIPRIKEIAVFDPRALKVWPVRRFTGVTFYNELSIMSGADDIKGATSCSRSSCRQCFSSIPLRPSLLCAT